MVDRQTILAFLRAGTLLAPFEESRTQTASYDLRLADQLLFDGGVVPLTPENPSFSIPPYSFIIAEALELADLPKFLSARFDLRVSLFMQGLILSNGPQVDPGFRGALFCMLYNASDERISLKRGDHFATIEFDTIAIGTTGARPTAYHYFDNLQRLSANILQRPGSKLLSRIDAVTPGVSKVLSGWTAAFAIGATALAVAAGWALTTATDAQNRLAEVRRQLDDAKETVQKIQADRVDFQSENQKASAELKARLQEAENLLEKLRSDSTRRR